MCSVQTGLYSTAGMHTVATCIFAPYVDGVDPSFLLPVHAVLTDGVSRKFLHPVTRLFTGKNI
jgi:hypothetical protein